MRKIKIFSSFEQIVMKSSMKCVILKVRYTLDEHVFSNFIAEFALYIY